MFILLNHLIMNIVFIIEIGFNLLVQICIALRTKIIVLKISNLAKFNVNTILKFLFRKV